MISFRKEAPRPNLGHWTPHDALLSFRNAKVGLESNQGQLHEQIDGHVEEFGELLGLRFADTAPAVQDFGHVALRQYGPEVARPHAFSLSR